MKRNLRLAAYIGIVLAVLGVTLAVPAAWATPSQHHAAQTVPTRGPSPTFAITFAPTESSTTQPPATALPGPTGAPNDTATPGPAPASTVMPAPAALLLTKQADRTVVWPGLLVTFTLALTNRGAASMRDVVVEDALPAGLIPGSIQSAGVTWDGSTLRGRTAVLPPGGRYSITFTARVRDDLAPGGIIVNQAAATAAGSQRATTGIVLVLPPAELPPTGASSAP